MQRLNKRILLITESLGAGGAERQICGLSAMLKNCGNECRLITYVENQYYESYLRQNGVDYALLPNLCEKSTRVFRLARYINVYKPDVVISYLPSVNITLCLAKPFINARLIVSERSNRVKVSLYDRLLFNLYRMADYVVPNSITQAEYIKKNFPFLTQRTRPIINFVDINRFKPSKNKTHGGTFRIITVARYIPSKNIIKYLKVVRVVKDMGLNVRFQWYGDRHSNEEYYASIEEEYHKLAVEDYLELNDVHRNIEEIYRTSDLFFLPSLLEGYPNVIVEAMSSGLPVICSNRFENPYIVENGQNGYLFDPEDVDGMVSAICKILNLTESDYLSMCKRNRECVVSRNSEKKFLKSYIDLIEKS